MRFVVGIVVAGIVLAPCGTAAVETAAAPAVKTAAAASGPSVDPEKKICKRITATGSNFPTKVCSTQAEWDAFKQKGHATDDAYDNARDQAGSGTNGERPQ